MAKFVMLTTLEEVLAARAADALWFAEIEHPTVFKKDGTQSWLLQEQWPNRHDARLYFPWENYIAVEDDEEESA